MKGLFLDNRLQLTSAFFYNEYDGFQIDLFQEYPEGVEPSLFASTPLTRYTSNVDDTKLWGFEVEAMFFLNENWWFSGYYNYLDSELGPHSSVTPGDPNPQYGQWEHLIVPFAGAAPILTSSPYELPTNKEGNQLAMQPNHKAAITAAFTTPAFGGNAQLLATWSYTGERHPYVGNLSSQEMPAYDRLDVRASWTAPDGRWTATLFIQNVLDEIGLIEYRPSSRNVVAELPTVATLTEERRLGLTVGFSL